MLQRISYIILFFSSVFFYGQVTLMSAVEEADLRVNQPFHLTVVLEISGDEYTQESPLRLPDFSRFNYIGNASDQNTFVDPRRKIVVNQIVYQVTLEPKEAGKMKIGSALVQVNGRMYKTEPLEFYVKDTEKKPVVADAPVKNDLFLNVEVKDRNVYKNQATVAVLRVFSSDFDNFRKVGEVKLPNQRNAQFIPVSFEKSEIEPATRKRLASQVIAVFMIFPREAGNVDIAPVSAALKDNKPGRIFSNRVHLNVKKFPEVAPVNYKNAVGDYQLDLYSESQENPEIDKPINVVVKVSGKGNMGVLSVPKLRKSENYNFFEPKIAYNTKTSNDGASGEILAHYIVIPKKQGIIDIRTEDFSYFNPQLKQFFEVGEKSLPVKILTSEEIYNAKSAIEKVNDYTNNVLETVNTPVLQTKKLQVLEKNRINWNAVFGNLALVFGLLVMGFFVRNKFRARKNVVKVPITSPIETVTETEEKIKQSLKVNYEADLIYLEKLNTEKKYSEFFAAFNEMRSETEARILRTKGETFKTFLERTLGPKFVEEYIHLTQKIQIEKFAPIHSDENMSELFESISQIYSQIKE